MPSDWSVAALDAMYATYTGDPALAPWTPDVHVPTTMVLIHCGIALLLTTVCVALRFYTRRCIVKELAMDDWLLIPAYLLSFYQIFYALPAILAKAAIATFFLRAIPAFTNPVHRWTIIILFWSYASYTLAFSFIVMWQCGDPTITGWLPSLAASCMSVAVLIPISTTAKVFTLSLDWLMTLVPALLVWRSSLRLSAKLSAIAILSLAGAGSVLAICSIALDNIYDVVNYPSDLRHASEYFLFGLWELGASLIVVSLAATRPLVRKWLSGGEAVAAGPGQGLIRTQNVSLAVHPHRDVEKQDGKWAQHHVLHVVQE
ncbi:hypothetical protein ANO11243_049380 [Dothideomycetidae sp. 11243]|nr:hypothetical protein ANO11243_049380 [fungal sp. No.11243]